jgi:hypothetical protein
LLVAHRSSFDDVLRLMDSQAVIANAQMERGLVTGSTSGRHR